MAYLVYLIFFLSLASAREALLEPIEIRGTPSGAWSSSSLIPSQQGELGSSHPRTAQHWLEGETSLPVAEYGLPGGLTQFRGVGVSADDVAVEALGVPLNPPQGGGFDFSSFPTFVWSAYQLDMGLSTGLSGPAGPGGRLSLTPWTAHALEEPGAAYEVRSFWASSEHYELSVGHHRDKKIAAQLGMTDGVSRGGAGAFSWKAVEGATGDGRVDVAIHLLGATTITETPGSTVFSTPRAFQTSHRMIPFAQMDSRSSHALLKTSVYGDLHYLSYDDPDSGLVTRDHTNQVGAQAFWLLNPWRIGFSGRRTAFTRIGFDAPTEWATRLQGAWRSQLGALMIEPNATLDSVSRLAFWPGGGLTLKSGPAFAGIGLSYRFPSLVDRYYDVPFFSGNPALKPEKTGALRLGAQWDNESWGGRFEGFYELRQDLMLTELGSTGRYQVSNSSMGEVQAGLANGWRRVIGDLRVEGDLAATRSKIRDTGGEIPYLPALAVVLGLRWNPEQASTKWSFGSRVRAQNRTASSVERDSEKMPGHGIWNLDASYQLLDLRVSAGIENVLNKKIEKVRYFPSSGRNWTLELTAQF